MSKFWDGAGIIAKKALTWACYGAVALGILSVPFAGVAGSLSWVGGLIGIDSAAGTSVLVGSLVNGALLGALFGTIKGAADIPEGLQGLEDDRMLAQQQRQVAQDKAVIQRSQLVQPQQEQQQTVAQNGVNVSPDAGVGKKPQQGVGV